MVNPKEINVRAFDKRAVPQLAPLTEYELLFVEDASTPIDLEIGCGVGWHPIAYAQNNPDRKLIAIEHTAEKFKKFEGRFQKHQLKNLLPVHANAISWVTTHLKEESLDRVLLLYPNPNPKDRSKRWICMPFMKQLLSCLKNEGELVMASNEGFYIEEVLDYAQNFWKLKLMKHEAVKIPRTHFEKKYLQRGETCTELVFKKIIER